MRNCTQPWCDKRKAYPLLALCRDCARPHLDECAARKVNPFRAPKGTKSSGQHEMVFNKTRWVWWRGAWRMTQPNKGSRK